MDKKGQGPIGFAFLIILFVVMWFLWLGEWLIIVGQNMITTNNLTGIEAFMYNNLNLWLFIVMVLGIIGYNYFGGGQ